MSSSLQAVTMAASRFGILEDLSGTLHTDLDKLTSIQTMQKLLHYALLSILTPSSAVQVTGVSMWFEWTASKAVDPYDMVN
jgi:hypothetical protein